MTTVENLYRFKLFCVTEDKFVVTVLSSTGTPTGPTECPNNSEHTIVSNSVRLVNTIYPDKSIVDENEKQDILTSGHYFADTIKVLTYADDPVPKQTVVSYPMNIAMFNAKFAVQSEHRCDRLVVEIAPNTDIGSPASSIDVGDTVIDIPTVMLDFVKAGFFITLKEGDTENYVGRICSVDWVNSQMTVETKTTDSFTTDADILRTIQYCDITFCDDKEYNLGSNLIGSTQIPANTPIVINYYNNSSGFKGLVFLIEMTY